MYFKPEFAFFSFFFTKGGRAEIAGQVFGGRLLLCFAPPWLYGIAVALPSLAVGIPIRNGLGAGGVWAVFHVKPLLGYRESCPHC